jgi:hypothetical protein
MLCAVTYVTHEQGMFWGPSKALAGVLIWNGKHWGSEARWFLLERGMLTRLAHLVVKSRIAAGFDVKSEQHNHCRNLFAFIALVQTMPVEAPIAFRCQDVSPVAGFPRERARCCDVCELEQDREGQARLVGLHLLRQRCPETRCWPPDARALMLAGMLLERRVPLRDCLQFQPRRVGLAADGSDSASLPPGPP